MLIQPKLQFALDMMTSDEALDKLVITADTIDIIEVGTILAFSEGVHALQRIRQHYPHKTLVCDMKITDASKILSAMAFEAGANLVTVSAAAHIETIRQAKQVADRYNGTIQIELYGHWTLEDVHDWVEMGITQAILHRSRDAELAGVDWSSADLALIQSLSNLGMQVSVTGGLSESSIQLFAQLPVYAFIIGRALCGENAKETALLFRQQMSLYWK